MSTKKGSFTHYHILVKDPFLWTHCSLGLVLSGNCLGIVWELFENESGLGLILEWEYFEPFLRMEVVWV